MIDARSDHALPDSQARRLAVETLDRPVLVEAGAGTGKTRLLVRRILHALEIGAARMPRVVAITFTEKAAAELRLRLRRELEIRLGEPDLEGAARARLARALLELDQATVSTIHAFAARLLRQRPMQAGIDPQFRTLDELESAHVFRAYWKRWVDAHLDDAATAAQLGAALLAGVRLEPDLEQLGRELDQQRDLIGALDVRPPADLTARMQAFGAAVQAALAHAERHCRVPGDGGVQCLRDLSARFDDLDRLPQESWPGVFLEAIRINAQAGRAPDWDDGEAAANKAMRKRLLEDLALVRQAISDRLLHGVLGWLRAFAADFEHEKRRRARLDFQDLLLYARRMLLADVAVRRELGGDIDMLCVDEFQDTDPLQAEIVWLLCETGPPATRWDDVVVGPKLFLVGDPKQSIYRFRRADLDVYERCAERLVACDGLRLDIVHNFRSRPAVIDWVNDVFATLFSTGGPRHVALSSEPDRLATPAVWVVRAPDNEPGAEAERRAEAGALVAFVARALGDGWPVRTKTGTRPLQPRDVALLFARTSGIEIYEAALRRAGLPFQQEGGRLFFQRQEVRDVLQALAAIDDPHDELAVVATLRSPLFGVTDSELWLHRVQHGGFGYLQPAPPQSPLAPGLEVLAAVHAARHSDGVAGTIAALLDRTGARAFHAAQPHGPQALANLEMLQRHAREFERGTGSGLREFVRMLRAVDRDVPRVAEWAPQEDEDDRIRVLTVHMAKGLEFGCVVLANLGARSQATAPALLMDRLGGRVEARLRASDADVRLATAGFEAARLRERERDAAEERRLLYVAATRARDYLVLPEPRPTAQGFARLVRSAPAAVRGGDALGPFVEAGATVPQARACSVDAAALPVPVPLRQRRATRAELAAASQARDAWPAAHARQLQAGGAGAISDVPPTSVAVAPASWSWRLLVARVLEAAATGEPIAAAARRLCALHGAAARATEVAALVAQAAEFERGYDSRRLRHGVQITAASGGRWIDERLDVVLADADGLVVVQWSLEPAPESPHEGEPLAALDALARAAGAPVHTGGTLCLASGTFVPFADLADRLARMSGWTMSG